MPTVSVVMAVYNGEAYLREAVESILSQSFGDFEFLIIDDGSTDATSAIVGSYADPRIVLVSNERNRGLACSLNRGIALASGKYVARQDADDVSEPERLREQVVFLEANPEVALVGTWYRMIDERGVSLGSETVPAGTTDLRWALLFYCPFAHSAVMWRRSLIAEEIGLYDERLSYSTDFDLWTRIADRFEVANIPQYLLRLRVNPSSMTATYGDRTREGYRLRATEVAALMGWPERDDPRRLEERYEPVRTLVGRTLATSDPKVVERAVSDVRRLHARFCARYELSDLDREARGRMLLAALSETLFVAAFRQLAASRPDQARKMLLVALRTFRRIAFTRYALRVVGGLACRLRLAVSHAGPRRLKDA